jgi:hypothetical protein
MPHALIVGQTQSGKSRLAKELGRAAMASGYGVLVFDPLRDPEWSECAALVTDQWPTFYASARASTGCYLVIDEPGELPKEYRDELTWCARMSRHRGHRCLFLAQRATLVPPVVRDNCPHGYIFRVTPDSAQVLSAVFGPAVEAAPELGQHYFLEFHPFQPVQTRKIRI